MSKDCESENNCFGWLSGRFVLRIIILQISKYLKVGMSLEKFKKLQSKQHFSLKYQKSLKRDWKEIEKYWKEIAPYIKIVKKESRDAFQTKSQQCCEQRNTMGHRIEHKKEWSFILKVLAL